jgi:hypothetical protein
MSLEAVSLKVGYLLKCNLLLLPTCRRSCLRSWQLKSNCLRAGDGIYYGMIVKHETWAGNKRSQVGALQGPPRLAEAACKG